MRNQKGFTLIEMLIVMLVISVLLFITIPNVTKHNSNINSKGCKAFVKMVEAQIQAYEIEKKKTPASIQELIDAGYIQKNSVGCPDNKTTVSIDASGNVITNPPLPAE